MNERLRVLKLEYNRLKEYIDQLTFKLKYTKVSAEERETLIFDRAYAINKFKEIKTLLQEVDANARNN